MHEAHILTLSVKTWFTLKTIFMCPTNLRDFNYFHLSNYDVIHFFYLLKINNTTLDCTNIPLKMGLTKNSCFKKNTKKINFLQNRNKKIEYSLFFCLV